MQKLLGMVGVASMLVLDGCGNKEQQYKTADGSEVKVATGSGDASVITSIAADGSQSRIETGGTWPAALAKLAPAYPGGKVATTMSGNQDDTESVVATFETADAPAKIVEFYKARAASAGLKGTMNLQSEDGHMFVASDEKTGQTLSVQAGVQDGKTSAVVSASIKKP